MDYLDTVIADAKLTRAEAASVLRFGLRALRVAQDGKLTDPSEVAHITHLASAMPKF